MRTMLIELMKMLVVVMMKMLAVVIMKMAPPFGLPHSVMLSVEKGVEVRLEIAWRTSTFVMIGIVLCKKECERKRQVFLKDNHNDK